MTPEINQKLIKLNAAYRFRIFSPSYAENEATGKLRQLDVGRVECDIFDLTIGELYATGKGPTERAALDDAMAKAAVAPKPMTPAQKLDAEERRQIDTANLKVSSLTRENDELKRRIAELEAAATQTRKPRGERSNQDPTNPTQ